MVFESLEHSLWVPWVAHRLSGESCLDAGQGSIRAVGVGLWEPKLLEGSVYTVVHTCRSCELMAPRPWGGPS